MRYIDTNPFVRAIANDHAEQSPRCQEFFDRLGADLEEATTSESVIAEVVYVLSSKVLFAFSRRGIRARLVPLIMAPGLQLDDKDQYIRAFQLYAETNLHFVDCLLVAHAEAEDEAVIVSFDRGLDRVPGVRREEP